MSGCEIQALPWGNVPATECLVYTLSLYLVPLFWTPISLFLGLFSLPPRGTEIIESQTMRALEDLRKILPQISHNASEKNEASSGGHRWVGSELRLEPRSPDF